MTTPNFSGFLSLFTNTTSTNDDILSDVSNQITLISSGTTLNGVKGPYYGRYFYVGNLLIQFSDFSTSYPPPSNVTSGGGSATINFPIAFSSKPYAVILTPTNNSGSNLNTYITLTSYTASSFSFHIGNDNGSTGFIAIGHR